jgi:hypothetical protein
VSGFLERLAARAAGHSDGLRPRVQSRFEPMALEETTFTTAAPEPATARTARELPVPPRGSRAEPRAPHVDAPVRPRASARAQQPDTPTRVPAGRAPDPAPVDAADATEAAPDEASLPVPAIVATEPPDPASPARREIVVDRPLDAPSDERPGTDLASGHVGVPARPAARRAANTPAVSRATASRRASAAERAPVEPVVSVTIGRVEIRAQVPPADVRPKHPEGSPTRLTPLEEYVEQRVKGAR